MHVYTCYKPSYLHPKGRLCNGIQQWHESRKMSRLSRIFDICSMHIRAGVNDSSSLASSSNRQSRSAAQHRGLPGTHETSCTPSPSPLASSSCSTCPAWSLFAESIRFRFLFHPLKIDPFSPCQFSRSLLKVPKSFRQLLSLSCSSAPSRSVSPGSFLNSCQNEPPTWAASLTRSWLPWLHLCPSVEQCPRRWQWGLALVCRGQPDRNVFLILQHPWLDWLHPEAQPQPARNRA